MKESAKISFSIPTLGHRLDQSTKEGLSSADLDCITALTASLKPTKRFLAPMARLYFCEIEAPMELILGVATNARERGFYVNVWPRGAYSESERRQAEYLALRGGKLIRSASKHPLTWEPGTDCPYCRFRGTVWKYHALAIREAPLGFQLRVVDHHVYVVTKEIASLLEEMQTTGLRLLKVPAVRSGSWFVLSSTHNLPPMASPPTLFDPPRPNIACGCLHGMGWPATKVFYAREGLLRGA